MRILCSGDGPSERLQLIWIGVGCGLFAIHSARATLPLRWLFFPPSDDDYASRGLPIAIRHQCADRFYLQHLCKSASCIVFHLAPLCASSHSAYSCCCYAGGADCTLAKRFERPFAVYNMSSACTNYLPSRKGAWLSSITILT